MTDKQLLELAAKAAGMKFSAYHPDFGIWDDDNGREWNPLTDDGDALRLAVKLRLNIQSLTHMVSVSFFDSTNEIDCTEDGDDPERATRRAIVRAAASIGEAMA